MPLALYLDHHVPRAVAQGLRIRGVDVLTAFEDGAHELSDRALLDRAQVLGRMLVTQDDDLLREAVRRQQAEVPFFGLIYARRLQASLGRYIQELELICQLGEPDEFANQVLYLPL